MLIIKNLCLQLHGFALTNINLNIKKGDYFVLLGASGSGKTVFLETIAGMYQPAGEIQFNHTSISALEIEKREIGFVYQNYELFPFLTVRENIIFGLKNQKLTRQAIKEKAEQYAALFHISHLLTRYPKHLSGGEQQRVALARALIISPKILLLDEPLSALDKNNKDNFIQQLKSLNTRFETTVIHVTHDTEEAIALADNIGIMRHGQLTTVMSKALFKNRLNTPGWQDMFSA